MRKAKPKCENHGENSYDTVDSSYHRHRVHKLEHMHPHKIGKTPEKDDGNRASQVCLEEDPPAKDESDS